LPSALLDSSIDTCQYDYSLSCALIPWLLYGLQQQHICNQLTQQCQQAMLCMTLYLLCLRSLSHTAGQYELDYLPHRLGNWQVWDSEKLQHSTSAKAAQTQRQAKGFLVDDRGHLLPGEERLGSCCLQ
jgi:hypothetical protein